MIGYYLCPTLAKACSLPSVTRLTYASRDGKQWLGSFYSEHVTEKTYCRRFNEQTFATVLFAQFPNLQYLTLVGQVKGANVIRDCLARELASRLISLDMFIDECNHSAYLEYGPEVQFWKTKWEESSKEPKAPVVVAGTGKTSMRVTKREPRHRRAKVRFSM